MKNGLLRFFDNLDWLPNLLKPLKLIMMQEGVAFTFVSDGAELKYVHQLQNLYYAFNQ